MKTLVDEMKEMSTLKNNCKKTKNTVAELTSILLVLKNKDNIMEN